MKTKKKTKKTKKPEPFVHYYYRYDPEKDLTFPAEKNITADVDELTGSVAVLCSGYAAYRTQGAYIRPKDARVLAKKLVEMADYLEGKEK